MIAVIVILHILLVIGFTVRILLRDDLSPPARLAWFIVLMALPYAGSLIYFLFGEIDLGHRADKRHAQVFAEIHAKAAPYFVPSASVDEMIEPVYRSAFRYAGSVNGFPTTGQNSGTLMADAQDTTDRMIADMDAARDHIHVLYYIWLDDKTGEDTARALIRAAKRGVTCRAMADGLGSRGFIRSRLWREMAEAGVQLSVALPLRNLITTILTSRVDLRNHRKITVIDGAISYCGSRNCADPEFRVKPRFAPWVDIMLRFEGPVVAQNQLLFLSDWMQATGEAYIDGLIEVKPQPGGFPALVIGDGPTERKGATPALFANLVASAQKRLVMSTPYFVPDATVLESLCAAAQRGVHVTLIFPRKNDSWVVAAASHSYYRKLLAAGCVIREYKDGLLHAKTLTLDGKVALIGSSNLDLRSFDLNYENNILLQDETLTAEIEARQLSYIARSEDVHLLDVLAWPVYRRIWNNIIATIGPVL